MILLTLSPAFTCNVFATGPLFLLQVMSEDVTSKTGELLGGNRMYPLRESPWPWSTPLIHAAWMVACEYASAETEASTNSCVILIFTVLENRQHERPRGKSFNTIEATQEKDDIFCLAITRRLPLQPFPTVASPGPFQKVAVRLSHERGEHIRLHVESMCSVEIICPPQNSDKRNKRNAGMPGEKRCGCQDIHFNRARAQAMFIGTAARIRYCRWLTARGWPILSTSKPIPVAWPIGHSHRALLLLDAS